MNNDTLKRQQKRQHFGNFEGVVRMETIISTMMTLVTWRGQDGKRTRNQRHSGNFEGASCRVDKTDEQWHFGNAEGAGREGNTKLATLWQLRRRKSDEKTISRDTLVTSGAQDWMGTRRERYYGNFEGTSRVEKS